MARLLLATNNQGKIAEYRRLFEDIPYQLVTPSDFDLNISVEETGHSMEQNAILKATAFAAASGLLTIADDSGLEVDALNGAPGVLSARYASIDAGDRDNVNYLLKRLDGVPRKKRCARFRCVIAMAGPSGLIEIVSGQCEGYITFKPRGEHGFGYDPIFYLPGKGKTMAEMSLDLKNMISHRARAAAKIMMLLKAPKHQFDDNIT
jgi:XTP/dITP diphosphohydrolase